MNVISTYTKVKEGDIIRLIPFELRNDISFLNFQWYSLKVQHKQFDTTTQEYSITTNSININLIEKYHEKFPNQRTDIWYLYPKEIDNWTNKLYAQNNNNGILVENHNTLLLRNDIGRSILGSNLSFKWQLHNRFDHNPVNPNEIYRVGLSDIYLYSPELLQSISTPSTAFLSEGFPQPDASQINAINNSLDRVISAIQGPPGTGKSQTIISLLHEYIARNEVDEQQRPTRILISSLSYNAMYVLIEKIRAHRGVDNNPSYLSQIPLYIIGEPSRSHPLADTIEIFSNNRPYRLYRQ